MDFRNCLWANNAVFDHTIWKEHCTDVYQNEIRKSVPFENSTLVLIEETTLPHTFLNTIFINETDYNNRNIETELFTHELTHVTQKHTLDVLFIETLKTIFWFNPIFYFYKKAIQLNHEFLADEKVVTKFSNVPFYQSLLLSKAETKMAFSLASNLNYSITKKRLLMMTKTTSKVKTAICQTALIPIITALVLLFCVKVNAQEKTTLSAEPINEKSTDKDRDRYYSGVQVIAKNTDGSVIVDKKYEQLTKAEKDRFLSYVPKKAEKKSLTASQFEDFKNASKHAIWIDGKNVPNAKLSNYKSSDFVSFTTSSVFKNARSKKFPQPFQSNLYTNDYFNKNLKDLYKKFSGDTVKITVGKYNNFGLKKKESGKKTKAELVQIGDSMYIKKSASKSDIYTAVEVKPDFPGGMKEFFKFVASNFIVPETFKGSGKIIAQFIVEKDGSLSEIKILKELGSGTGEEALRILKQSPKWKPGIQNGEPVRVLYSLPISITAAK